MSAFPLLRGRRMRVVKLDGCGNPKLGPSNQVVTKGFITVGLTPNVDQGEAIQVTNASGEQCINDQPEPQFLNWSVESTFCNVDPELFTMMTGQPLVLSGDGTEAVGFRVNSKVDVSKSGFSMELWMGTPTDDCDDDTEIAYGYMLLPYLKGGSIGDLTVENGAVNFVITGASTKDGSHWGVGPFDVTRDEDGDPGPLNEAITSGDHSHTEKVTVAPPDVTDGAVALGVPATLITAGIPATLSPANSYAPANLAALISAAPTKTPTTAWTTGQYVLLQDGSKAHWSSSAWVTGAA